MQKKLLALALAAMGASGAAQATALGQSVLEVTNVIFSNNATGVALDATAFDVLNIVDTTNLNPTLTPGGANPQVVVTVGGAPIPLTVACVPAACTGLPAATPFTHIVAGPATVDGALAASSLDGAPLTGLGQPLGANARTASLAERTTAGSGNTSSSLSLAAQFSFSLTNDTVVRFDFNALLHEIAFVDSPVNAFAGSAWNLKIVDQGTGATVFDWTPDGIVGPITGGTEQLDACNLTTSVTAFYSGAPVTNTTDCGGAFRATTGLLLAANTYNLSITHQNQANVIVAQAVPEPGSLALLGISLLGLFGARRFSKSR